MMPGMIEQGYRALVVSMDTWGLATMIHGVVEQGRKSAHEIGNPSKTEEHNVV